jgi:hypothetical protein
MPKHHKIILTVETNPHERTIEFGPFEQGDAQKIKSALESAMGDKIRKAEVVRDPGS